MRYVEIKCNLRTFHDLRGIPFSAQHCDCDSVCAAIAFPDIKYFLPVIDTVPSG